MAQRFAPFRVRLSAHPAAGGLIPGSPVLVFSHPSRGRMPCLTDDPRPLPAAAEAGSAYPSPMRKMVNVGVREAENFDSFDRERHLTGVSVRYPQDYGDISLEFTKRRR